MNDYSMYDPEYCDGNVCIVDCGKCKIAEKIREKLHDDEEFDGDGDVFYGNESEAF